MAQWTHTCCEHCWFATPGWGNVDHDRVRIPTRVKESDLRICCMCNAPTVAGIFIRRDPAQTPNCTCEEDHE